MLHYQDTTSQWCVCAPALHNPPLNGSFDEIWKTSRGWEYFWDIPNQHIVRFLNEAIRTSWDQPHASFPTRLCDLTAWGPLLTVIHEEGRLRLSGRCCLPQNAPHAVRRLRRRIAAGEINRPYDSSEGRQRDDKRMSSVPKHVSASADASSLVSVRKKKLNRGG